MWPSLRQQQRTKCGIKVNAARARAHRRLQQQVAATRVTAPQIPVRLMFGLRPAWSPSPAHHNLAREGRPQPVGPPRGGQQLQAHPPANFAAAAQRPPGRERGWQVGSLPARGPERRRRGGDSRAQSQRTKVERQVERPLRLFGQGQVGGLVEERGQATLHCVVVSPGSPQSPQGGAYEAGSWLGARHKTAKAATRLAGPTRTGAVGAVRPASHACGAAHAGRRPRFQAGHRGLGYLAGGGQGPGASPDCVPARHLEVSDVRRFLTSGVPDARFPGIELYARVAPQGLLQGGVHCRNALGGRDVVSVVQKGENRRWAAEASRAG